MHGRVQRHARWGDGKLLLDRKTLSRRRARRRFILITGKAHAHYYNSLVRTRFFANSYAVWWSSRVHAGSPPRCVPDDCNTMAYLRIFVNTFSPPFRFDPETADVKPRRLQVGSVPIQYARALINNNDDRVRTVVLLVAYECSHICRTSVVRRGFGQFKHDVLYHTHRCILVCYRWHLISQLISVPKQWCIKRGLGAGLNRPWNLFLLTNNNILKIAEFIVLWLWKPPWNEILYTPLSRTVNILIGLPIFRVKM